MYADKYGMGVALLSILWVDLSIGLQPDYIGFGHAGTRLPKGTSSGNAAYVFLIPHFLEAFV